MVNVRLNTGRIKIFLQNLVTEHPCCWLLPNCFIMAVTSVADSDPHGSASFWKLDLDPDPQQSRKQDPDPHQSEKQDPDQHKSE
jgi:hypothetical protein